MIISRKHKFISLDPPKTGTNYRQNFFVRNVESSFTDKSLQHANINEIKEYFSDDFDDFFVFTFVRNPWERYVSWFHWINKNKPSEVINKENFSLFLERHLVSNTRNPSLKIQQPQSSWFMNEGELNVDFVGSLENMEEDMKFLLQKLNLTGHLTSKKSNAIARKSQTSELYNQDSIDLVAEKEKCVIELKGYKYE